MKRLLLLLLSTTLSLMILSIFQEFGRVPGTAWAQVGGAPETSPVGVIEGGSEPEPSRVILKLAGAACEVNAVESIALRLKGVVAVDIETKKGHLVVDYDPNKLTAQQVTDTLMRKKGCFAPIVPVVPGGVGP